LDDREKRTEMRLSVVILTWNEQLWLPRLLQSLTVIHNLAEIIVVDNASADATVAIAKVYGRRVISDGKPGVARNLGAKVASGDIILFIDADAIVNKRIVELALEHLSARNVVTVVKAGVQNTKVGLAITSNINSQRCLFGFGLLLSVCNPQGAYSGYVRKPAISMQRTKK
jgi:glycosyltransferase involved in cell wall biosynthesis